MRGVENLLSAEVEVAKCALGAGEPTFRQAESGRIVMPMVLRRTLSVQARQLTS